MKYLIWIIIGLVVLIAVTTNIYSLIKKHRILRDNLQQLTQQKLAAQQEKSRLTNIIQEGQTKEEKEKEARIMLGYKKKGERVVLVVPSSSSEPKVTSEVSSGSKKSHISFWKQIWYNIQRLFKK